MKVILHLDFDNEQRKIISAQYGEKKLATRSDIRSWINAMIQSSLEDLSSDYQTMYESSNDE